MPSRYDTFDPGPLFTEDATRFNLPDNLFKTLLGKWHQKPAQLAKLTPDEVGGGTFTVVVTYRLEVGGTVFEVPAGQLTL